MIMSNTPNASQKWALIIGVALITLIAFPSCEKDELPEPTKQEKPETKCSCGGK